MLKSATSSAAEEDQKEPSLPPPNLIKTRGVGKAYVCVRALFAAEENEEENRFFLSTKIMRPGEGREKSVARFAESGLKFSRIERKIYERGESAWKCVFS